MECRPLSFLVANGRMQCLGERKRKALIYCASQSQQGAIDRSFCQSPASRGNVGGWPFDGCGASGDSGVSDGCGESDDFSRNAFARNFIA